MNRVFDFIVNADEDAKLMFASDVESLIMDLYYNKYWKDNSDSFERSGKVLSTEVNLLRPKSVLDVGCGNNNFKDTIYDLVGIDPFNDKADVKQSLIEYQQQNPDIQHDVVLALDSINTGRKPIILHHFEMIDKLTKPGGYQFWRVNHVGVPDCEEFPLINLIDFYDWDEKFIRELAEYYGYEVKELCEEINSQGEKRLFFCFYKY